MAEVTPDSRTTLERLNAVLYHLSEAQRAEDDLAKVRFHVAEAERQVVDLFNDAGERELVERVGR